jgi:hypothetical protein
MPVDEDDLMSDDEGMEEECEKMEEECDEDQRLETSMNEMSVLKMFADVSSFLKTVDTGGARLSRVVANLVRLLPSTFRSPHCHTALDTSTTCICTACICTTPLCRHHADTHHPFYPLPHYTRQPVTMLTPTTRSTHCHITLDTTTGGWMHRAQKPGIRRP